MIHDNFDPESEVNAEFDVTLDTERTLLEANEDEGYIVTIGKPELRGGVVEKEGKFKGRPWRSLSLPLKVNSSNVPASYGRDEALIYDNVRLDVDDAGTLLSGTNRNIMLAQYYEAAGLRDSEGRIRGRFSDLEGKVVRVGISHRADREGTVRENVRWVRMI